MTVSTTSIKNSYSGDDSTTGFVFSFPITAETDLRVILRDSSDVETVQTITTDYTVSASPWPAGGTVTMLTAPATGETLVIKADIPITQGVDYLTAGRFPAESHEAALDRLTLILQQITETIGRNLTLSETTAITDFVVPDPVTDGALTYDGVDFTWVELGTLSPGTVTTTAYSRTLLDDASAAAMLVTLGIDDEITTVGTITSFIDTLIDDADAPTARATLGAAIPLGDVLCPHQDLVAEWISNTTFDVDATTVVLRDANGNRKEFSTLNATIDSTNTAGLIEAIDTGAWATSTWHYFYAVGKADGTVSAVASLSSSAPSPLPTDYIYYGLLGAVYRDSGDLFDYFYQTGKDVYIDATTAWTAQTNTSPTLANIAVIIPPIARSASIRLTANLVSGSQVSANVYPTSTGSRGGGSITVGSSTVRVDGMVNLSLNAAAPQSVYHSASSGDNSDGFVHGWGY